MRLLLGFLRISLLIPFIECSRQVQSSLLEAGGTTKSFENVVVQSRKEARKTTSSSSLSLMESLLKASTLRPRNDRRLDDGDNDDYFLNQNKLYSLSGYSLKYAKCQTIQRFSEEAVKNGEYSSMVKDDIVILRLCPTNKCSSSNQFGCHYNYAEYAIGISDYIRIMLRYSMDKTEKLCDYCQQCFGGNGGNNNNRRRRAEEENQGEEENQENEGNEQEEQQEGGEEGNNENDNFDDDDYYKADNNDEDEQDEANNEEDNNYQDANDDGGDDEDADDDDPCNYYKDSCDEISNMCNGNGNDENNGDDDAVVMGYMDYMDYLDCAKVEGQDEQYYWVKPRCDGSKGTIQMDIFYDPYCSQYAGNDINLREYSGINFKDSMFQDYYDGECINCAESNDAPFYNAHSQMCNKVYYESARCTSNMVYQIFDEDYYSDDSTACSFIESVRFGTYNEKGEIYVDSSEFGEQVKAEVTTGQLVGLVVSLALCVGLGLYSCYLHHNITNLLIKSLSHSHLLPPSRHRSRGRTRNGGKSGSSKRTAGSQKSKSSSETISESDWDHSAGAPA